MNASGSKIFITGGARRLGREMALHFISLGAEVIVHYNHSEAEAIALQKQTGCKLLRADFSTIKMADLKKRLENEIGQVDVLLNNASSFQKRTWTEIDEEFWDHEFSVNLKVPFFLSQYFGPKMKSRGHGKILTLGDIAGMRPYTGYLPYSIAKGSLAIMTEALARLLAPEVQVNAIAPSMVLIMDGVSPEESRKLVEKIPARRTATIEEFLRTVDFLLWQVDYITGQTIVLDGGRSLT